MSKPKRLIDGGQERQLITEVVLLHHRPDLLLESSKSAEDVSKTRPKGPIFLGFRVIFIDVHRVFLVFSCFF